jgi:hypothetical protein
VKYTGGGGTFLSLLHQQLIAAVSGGGGKGKYFRLKHRVYERLCFSLKTPPPVEGERMSATIRRVTLVTQPYGRRTYSLD